MTTFLLVDDSPVVRKIARRFLQGFGFTVHEAEDGVPAIAHCEAAMPDAILLDWNMPVMTGIEFLRALRKLAGGDKPVVIFCTTETDVGFVQVALAAGAADYIFKPFDAPTLRAKLETVGLLATA